MALCILAWGFGNHKTGGRDASGYSDSPVQARTLAGAIPFGPYSGRRAEEHAKKTVQLQKCGKRSIRAANRNGTDAPPSGHRRCSFSLPAATGWERVLCGDSPLRIRIGQNPYFSCSWSVSHGNTPASLTCVINRCQLHRRRSAGFMSAFRVSSNALCPEPPGMNAGFLPS